MVAIICIYFSGRHSVRLINYSLCVVDIQVIGIVLSLMLIPIACFISCAAESLYAYIRKNLSKWKQALGKIMDGVEKQLEYDINSLSLISQGRVSDA